MYSHKLRPEQATATSVSSGDLNSFEVHDTFRSGFRQVKQELAPKHPLENELAKVSMWRNASRMGICVLTFCFGWVVGGTATSVEAYHVEKRLWNSRID
jgi:hypothetical protein